MEKEYPRCNHRYVTYFFRYKMYSCKPCEYVFSDYAYTYLITLKISFDIIFHLLSLFVIDVHAIRSTTIGRGFRIFGQAIYNLLLHEIHFMKLSEQIEVDVMCKPDSYVQIYNHTNMTDPYKFYL
ncbi:MAG TPA: hypothetical protein VJ767_10120 [Nitrososphaeraceae archaeon]|nr:hypothetical protein [Nitrososphaeraceae archaeon]